MDLGIVYTNISKIITLTDAEKTIFESLLEIINIKRKDILLIEGQICRYEYFILEGCLMSYFTDKNLMEHTTMFAVEGWWTGNLKSFVQNHPSEFSIIALEDTTLLRFSKPKLEELFEKVTKFERYFRILLQNRLLATQDRVINHLSATALETYELFQKKIPALENRIPLKYIASYLGITPSYLSRLRRRRMSK